jgi:hypothetical protein
MNVKGMGRKCINVRKQGEKAVSLAGSLVGWRTVGAA